MSLEPKKTGGPIQKFWDSPEIVTSLESVKGWLSKNAKKVRFLLKIPIIMAEYFKEESLLIIWTMTNALSM